MTRPSRTAHGSARSWESRDSGSRRSWDWATVSSQPEIFRTGCDISPAASATVRANHPTGGPARSSQRDHLCAVLHNGQPTGKPTIERDERTRHDRYSRI